MKKAIIFSAIVISSFLGGCINTSSGSMNGRDSSQVFNLDTTKLKAGEKYYQCAMNPEVISDSAGHCPKCNMELVEKIKK